MTKKKVLAIASVLSIAALVLSAGTLAYFTDRTDTKTNTFTLGKVNIELTETVAKDVPDVLEDGFGGDEGKQEPTPVLPGKLEQDADDAERAVAEHEEHAHQEREHERMEAGCETFNHKSWPA